MEDIHTIVTKNRELFGDAPIIKKIEVGFTNQVYNVNHSYIVKICSNKNNEESFQKEIDFYQKYKNYNFIPKLFIADTSKKDVSYDYEILEKIKGVSLYQVWHSLTDFQREEVIKKVVDILKIIHSNKGKKQDWTKYLQERFEMSYPKVKNLFSKEEQEWIMYAFSKFSHYLESSDFVLVHNDLHFDNIFYCNGEIKIIDFERTTYAPKDFELDILYRMIKDPWKFASEKEEGQIHYSDYTNIKYYIEKYYSELVNIPYFDQRLAIYDIIYCLRQLKEYPNSTELKKDILLSAKIVALKDELFFEKIRTAVQLMDFMSIHIQYGYIDMNGKKHIDNLDGIRENYRTASLQEILSSGIGTCIETTKLEKYFFDKAGIENRIYCLRRYETESSTFQDVKMHCFLLYQEQNSWYHFEYANSEKRGIHKYKTPEEVIQAEIDRHDSDDVRELSEIYDIPDGLTFQEFNQYVNQTGNKKEKIK